MKKIKLQIIELLALLLIVGYLYFYGSVSEHTIIDCVLIELPEFSEVGGDVPHNIINLKTEKGSFTVSGCSYDVIDSYLVSQLEKGDTVILGITKKLFKTKVVSLESLSLGCVLELDEYNNCIKRSSILYFIVIIGMFIYIIISAIVKLQRNNKA